MREQFTSVRRVRIEPTPPFQALALEAPGWRRIGHATSRGAAEAIARGWRIDHRGAETRVTETRRPAGYFYQAV